MILFAQANDICGIWLEEQKRLHRALLQPAFGGKTQVGPIGDLFRINDVITTVNIKKIFCLMLN